jgi:S1-C subfamily serine protease
MNKIIIFIVLTLLFGLPYHSDSREFNTIMMQATCKITGKGSLGTGFIIGKPYSTNPPKAFYTLVTAAHVLKAVQGDTIILLLRKREESGLWKRLNVRVQIRNNNKPLWKTHPEVDLAAMFVRLPEGTIENLLSTDALLTDEQFEEYEIHPGFDILCLGYPFGAEANEYGFPILRSGKIASYPLTPAKQLKTFLFDFAVFRGNSGGPVYFVQKSPTFGRLLQVGKIIQGILGIVVREKNITQKIEQLYEKRETITPLSLAEVIHAAFIRELVDTLDTPRQAPNKAMSSD